MLDRGASFRVLIVDDDPALLDALSESLRLRWESLVTETCDNAAAALARVAEQDYDAIVSDIKMPGTDGLELLAEVRDLRPHVPVLLITGHGETDLAIRALRAGAYDLIQKPLDRDYLIAALQRAIETRQLRRELDEKRAALEKHAEELERRVEERTADLVQANRAKDEFLGLVSHELRTPITVILGNADVLFRISEDMSPKDRVVAIADLRLEAQRLQRIVDNLLVLARLDHKRAVESEPVHLQRIVLNQVQVHRQTFPHRKIAVHVEPDLPVVLADPIHVELVLRNLLSNAEKYSPADRPVTVAVSVPDGQVSVSVLDEGDGISEADSRALFTPFFRSAQTAGVVPGIGIGLAVCKRLVEAHGGHISARPRPGGGTEFAFDLPAVAECAEPEPASERVAAAGTA